MEDNQELRRKRTEYEQPDFLIPLAPQADGESTLDEIEWKLGLVDLRVCTGAGSPLAGEIN